MESQRKYVSRQALRLGMGHPQHLARLAGAGGLRRSRNRRLLPVPAGPRSGRYLFYIAVLCALLIGVCWLKGEPPRWRWGNNE